MDQKGFTLIELIVIIVILGILAVTAIPKYVDMKTEAKNAAADGVYGAAQGAAAMNFAAGLLNISGHEKIIDGATLIAAMDATPDGWIADTDGLDLCLDDKATTAADCEGTYTITITDETTTDKAKIAKGW
jgi:MSHA pilin protein MshA